MKRRKSKIAQIPWQAIGAPLGILGTQLPPPWSYSCYVAAAFCTMLYGICHYKERK